MCAAFERASTMVSATTTPLLICSNAGLRIRGNLSHEGGFHCFDLITIPGGVIMPALARQAFDTILSSAVKHALDPEPTNRTPCPSKINRTNARKMPRPRKVSVWSITRSQFLASSAALTSISSEFTVVTS